MRRVLMLGCPGSGKSTLAKRLSDKLELPLVHLDQLYWHPGWTKPEHNEWVQRLSEALAYPAWIMDGNYTSTLGQRLAAADTAVLLDPPRWLCLYRILRRILLHLGRTRADMTPGCPERLDWDLFVYVWHFRERERPTLMAELQAFAGTVVILDSRRKALTFRP